MNFDDFLVIHTQKKANNPVFELDAEKCVVNSNIIEDFENTYKVKLPDYFKSFMLYFQNCYFGYLTILCVNQESDFYIGNILNLLSFNNNIEYLPFCDDGTGGYYCFKTSGNTDAIFLLTKHTVLIAPNIKIF